MHRGDFLRRLSVGVLDKRLINGHKRTIRLIERRVGKIKKAMERIARMTTTVVVSPELESNLSQEAFSVFAAAIRRVWDVQVVANPQNPANMALADYFEHHGDSYPSHSKIIYNMDGVSVNLEDGEGYFRQWSYKETLGNIETASCRFATFLWSANQQGLGNATGWGSAGALPPRKRKFIVTTQAILVMHDLLEALGR
jgi:hypothetical protein